MGNQWPREWSPSRGEKSSLRRRQSLCVISSGFKWRARRAKRQEKANLQAQLVLDLDLGPSLVAVSLSKSTVRSSGSIERENEKKRAKSKFWGASCCLLLFVCVRLCALGCVLRPKLKT